MKADDEEVIAYRLVGDHFEQIQIPDEIYHQSRALGVIKTAERLAEHFHYGFSTVLLIGEYNFGDRPTALQPVTVTHNRYCGIMGIREI